AARGNRASACRRRRIRELRSAFEFPSCDAEGSVSTNQDAVEGSEVAATWVANVQIRSIREERNEAKPSSGNIQRQTLLRRSRPHHYFHGRRGPRLRDAEPGARHGAHLPRSF